MPEEKPQTESMLYPLSGAVEEPDGSANKSHIDIIMAEEIPVLCINRSTKKKRIMPFKVLYDTNNSFWNQEGGWEYYLDEDNFEKLKEKVNESSHSLNLEFQNMEKKVVEVGFGDEYELIDKMSPTEKIGVIFKSKQRLVELAAQKTKSPSAVTEALVDTSRDVALVNHSALKEAIRLGDDEAKRLTQTLVDSTKEMVQSSISLISDEVMNNELMNSLVERSNGTIVQHMTRVYLTGISFLTFYNNLVSTSSTIQKIRIAFAKKYSGFYRSLLPHMDVSEIALERVFMGGMRAISHDLLNNWAVGFLIHDIGKATAVEYHEGEAKYDRGTVIEHVKLGYHSVLNKTNYPMEASLIVGYHHEYYGSPEGYGYFRAYLQQYKKLNPDAKHDYCITFEKEPILDYQALAYFPAKVLEIIDVYDSVTDPNRVYRKAMSPEEALAMMREQFIIKNRKIDPVLFDIFELFINEQQKMKNAR